jgi:hypothetical protein
MLVRLQNQREQRRRIHHINKRCMIAENQSPCRRAKSKGKGKKPKADKLAPKTGVSPYEAEQGTGKPAVSPCAKKPGR